MRETITRAKNADKDWMLIKAAAMASVLEEYLSNMGDDERAANAAVIAGEIKDLIRLAM